MTPVVAVVIPCFRVRAHIADLLRGIGPDVALIYVVDDKCPEETGKLVEAEGRDPRVRVLYHAENQGVGGAVLTGYRRAIADGARVVVKLDGDGQMDPALIPRFIRPIVDGVADYAKGNRFDELDGLGGMPRLRLFGNAVLSFFSKASSGYWDIFDPTNGFTAIDAAVLEKLPMDKISRRYFFESDMLFRLGILRAVVVDVPMFARYGEEKSNLKVGRIVGEFAAKHMLNLAKRIFYTYYLRSFNIASIELLLGPLLLTFGTAVGAAGWYRSAQTGNTASSGTVMLAALPIVIGVQLLLGFLSYDMQNVPRRPLQGRL